MAPSVGTENWISWAWDQDPKQALEKTIFFVDEQR